MSPTLNLTRLFCNEPKLLTVVEHSVNSIVRPSEADADARLISAEIQHGPHKLNINYHQPRQGIVDISFSENDIAITTANETRTLTYMEINELIWLYDARCNYWARTDIRCFFALPYLTREQSYEKLLQFISSAIEVIVIDEHVRKGYSFPEKVAAFFVPLFIVTINPK